MSVSFKNEKPSIVHVNASGSMYVNIPDLENTAEYKEFTASVRSLSFAQELAEDVQKVGDRLRVQLAQKKSKLAGG